MEGFVFLLFASAFAYDPAIPPDALSLYPCDEGKFEGIMKAYALFQKCEQQAQDPNWCLNQVGLSGPLCLCIVCSDAFAFALSTYEDVVRAGQCPVQLYNNTFGQIPTVLMRYPCLFKQLSNQTLSKVCPNPNLWMCGIPPLATLLPLPGANTFQMCQGAMQGGCSDGALWRGGGRDSINPWCSKNNKGVAFTNSTGAPAYQSTYVSILDFACDPTSLYATQIVQTTPGFDSGAFKVLLFNTSDSLTTSGSIELLPKYKTQGYDAPPTNIMWQPGGMYDILSCLPGLYCQTSWVKQCWKGSYCPTTTTSFGCWKGSYCPAGSTNPRKCGLLEQCDENYQSTRTQLLPVVVAAAILVLGILIHTIAKICECCANRRVHPDNEFVALSSAPASTAQVDIQFQNVTVEVGQGDTRKTILHGASGNFSPGSLTAVMGPSGSSKSTLLDALLGNIKCTSDSSILVNGEEGNLAAYRGIVGFVGQHDVLHRNLTVREAIYHSAFLRLPSSMSRADIQAEVESVLQELDLTGCANTIIGDGEKRGVSGGQRKRTSIGVELVANSRALFMDEPTTGLSSTQSLALTRTMKQLARGGRTVVSIIHQPRYEMFVEFDSIMFLAKGNVCYQGPQNLVIPFFHQLGYSAVSPEELMDVLCGTADPSISHTPQELAQQFTLWKSKVEHVSQPSASARSLFAIPNGKSHVCASRLPSGALRQFWAHFALEFKLRYRNPGSTLTFAFIYLFAGALLGVGFLQTDGNS